MPRPLPTVRPSARARGAGVAWLAALLVGSVVVASTVRVRRAEKAALTELATLTTTLSTLAAPGSGPRRILLNGHAVVVATETVSGTSEGALDVVARECASGDPRVALGLPLPAREGEGAARPWRVHLEAVKRQTADGASAALCVFRDETVGVDSPASRLGPGDPPAPRVRYALAREHDHGRVALLSVTTEAESTLAELFPESGDAPGSDPPHGARPPGSRRVLTAQIEGRPFAIRLYEVEGSLRRAVMDYDRAMTASGWASSPAVAGALDDARLFSRDGDELVASFDARAGTTTIALAAAPFGAR